MQLFDGMAKNVAKIANLVVESADILLEKIGSGMREEPDAEHGMAASGADGQGACDLSPKLDWGIQFVISPPGAFAKIEDHFHIPAGENGVHKGGIRCGMKEIIMPDVGL